MVLGITAEDKIIRQRQQQKAWRQANPDTIKAYYHHHRSRPEHCERIRLWHSTHREHINQQARERYRNKIALHLSEDTRQAVEVRVSDLNPRSPAELADLILDLDLPELLSLP